MAYRLVMFDFDGTLADSFDWFTAQLPAVTETFKLRPTSPAEMAELRGLHARAVMRRLGVPWWRLPAIATHMRRLMAASAHDIHLFPGVADALDELHARGVALAVVSSNAEATVRTVLGERQRLISTFACGVSVFGKAPAMRKVMRRARARPDDVIAIGDEVRDLEAARRVGVRFGGVSWGYSTPEALAAADHRFAAPADWVKTIAPDA